MDKYQSPNSSHPSHPGENDAKAQSTGALHPAQHTSGVPDHSTTNGATGKKGHARISFSPTHTCATCQKTARSNHALEVHAREQNHQAFLCRCGIRFKRLFTLDRHIADQPGSKHRCNFCDDKKGFAREDKLIDHLRSGHKFGEKAIAQIRNQERFSSGGDGLASNAATTTGAALPVSTSTGYAAPFAVAAGGQNVLESSVGPSAEPFGFFHNGVADHSMLNIADLQPFSSGGDYRFPGAPTGLAGSNAFVGDFAGDHFGGFGGSVPGPSGAEYPGFDFADFDLELDMSGMDNGI